MEIKTPTVARISLANLAANFKEIQKKAGDCRLIGVVKANGYGHGAVEISRQLMKCGCDFFAVARIAEALELLENGITPNIIIFGALLPEEVKLAAEKGLRITLADEAMLKPVFDAAENSGREVRLHINVDTGMGRTGILPENLPGVLIQLGQYKNILIEGIYTHFATSDEADKTYANRQLAVFKKVIADLGDNVPPMVHCANSGAILDMPETCLPPFTAARPGIILYGHYPTNEVSEFIPLRQVMTFASTVAQVRYLKQGTKVSYGCRFVMPQDGYVAVLPVGYADGYQRAFTNRGQVLIKGRAFPVAGTVTMDQIIVYTGNEKAEIGEEAVLWGEQGEQVLQATELGAEIGTISYELCCGVSKRVPRIY